eukprot:TRINITY_DN5915_c0_g7_i1.p1 TRINITY_DN5915_c0_g7~~TRINITY_DN5915_c0_g7_i1.p1  ORF type:complete len:430 (+),score=177.54 TRINITY_DN5915_c0_g7_i1:67-1356(+)
MQMRRCAAQALRRAASAAPSPAGSRRTTPAPSPVAARTRTVAAAPRSIQGAVARPSALTRPMGRAYCTSVKCPQIAESISEGKVGQWNVKVGDQVEEDQVLVEIESDKVGVPVMAPHDGVVTACLLEEGETVQVGQELAKLKEQAVEKSDAGAAPAAAPAAAEKKEKKEKAAAPAPAPARPAAAPVATAPSDGSREKRVRITPMRARIADRLKASQNTAAMLTTFQEVDMSTIIALRNKYKDEFAKKHGVKLGFMSAFVKAAAIALTDIPVVNAYMDTEENCIVYRDYVDISVAVAAPKGLVVPVLRDCQDMNFADIEKQIGVFADKAKKGTLTLPEMTGGTFTISNGGTYGSLFGTPIINPPQSAVLGMHATKQKPWVLPDGSIAARPIMVIALTYDHRLIDGRDAVTLLVKIKNLVEDPARIVLDLA